MGWICGYTYMHMYANMFLKTERNFSNGFGRFCFKNNGDLDIFVSRNLGCVAYIIFNMFMHDFNSGYHCLYIGQ